jgi:hypothetical protein
MVDARRTASGRCSPLLLVPAAVFLWHGGPRPHTMCSRFRLRSSMFRKIKTGG